MSLKLILKKKGKKHAPFFQLCVKNTDSNQILDKIGVFEIQSNKNKCNLNNKYIKINLFKYLFWLNKGMILSKNFLLYIYYLNFLSTK